jgi:hypothetical protein
MEVVIGPGQYESVNIDPTPVPGWYESTQYQYPTGMYVKGTYQYNMSGRPPE